MKNLVLDCGDGCSFKLADGKEIKNLNELNKSLENIDENVFRHHANDERNDFSNWVRDVVGDEKLAEDLSRTKEKNIAITINQLQKKGVFRFPLDIFIQEKLSTPKLMTWMVSKNSETFTFPVKSKPVKVKVDPYTSLLFEGTVTEIK